jgi:hypothetical protein
MNTIVLRTQKDVDDYLSEVAIGLAASIRACRTIVIATQVSRFEGVEKEVNGQQCVVRFPDGGSAAVMFTIVRDVERETHKLNLRTAVEQARMAAEMAIANELANPRTRPLT